MGLRPYRQQAEIFWLIPNRKQQNKNKKPKRKVTQTPSVLNSYVDNIHKIRDKLTQRVFCHFFCSCMLLTQYNTVLLTNLALFIRNSQIRKKHEINRVKPNLVSLA